MIRSGASLNVLDEFQDFPLDEAAHENRPDIAEMLLAAGADPKLTTPAGSTALMRAAWSGSVAVAKLLLEHGAQVNAADVHGETALILASQTCPDGVMVQLLLDHGADPNAQGPAALIAAAGHPMVVEKLLKAGADPAAKDAYGHTVEDAACDRGEKGHFEVCTLVRQALGKK